MGWTHGDEKTQNTSEQKRLSLLLFPSNTVTVKGFIRCNRHLAQILAIPSSPIALVAPRESRGLNRSLYVPFDPQLEGILRILVPNSQILWFQRRVSPSSVD